VYIYMPGSSSVRLLIPLSSVVQQRRGRVDNMCWNSGPLQKRTSLRQPTPFLTAVSNALPESTTSNPF
jgi:hypothetical protein